MNKFHILFLFFVLISNEVSSQIIRGKIINEQNELVNKAIVYLNNKSKIKNLTQFKQVKNGLFDIDVTSFENELEIITKSNGYISDTLYLNKIQFSGKVVNIILKKEKSILLEEVKIKANQLPFKIKNDTLKYKVKSFSDGTERKLEDILKKLPGIEVNNTTGAIKYKGRNIETIMLEGDNLFGNDYLIGSKNINFDLIDEVEAIDNFSENPLLKGLEDKDKVALNLKLKKGLLSLSAETDFGLGMIEEKKLAKDIALTSLAISKKIKAFTILSNNNLGINRSPINYYFNVESFPKKIIEEDFPINQINKAYNYNNNQYLSSFNLIFNLNTNFSIKFNNSIIDDEILFYRFNYNRYNINNYEIINEDSFSNLKNFFLIKTDIKAKYKLNKKSNIEYDFSNFNNCIDANNNFQSTTSLISLYSTNSRFNNFKNNILYTFKFNDKNVIQISARNELNSLKQNLIYSPYQLDFLNDFEQQNYQNTKRSTMFLAKLLSQTKRKGDKYSFSLAFTNDKTLLNSDRIGVRNQEIINYEQYNNITEYNSTSLYNTGRYNKIFKNLKSSIDYKISLINQRLNYLDVGFNNLFNSQLLYQLNYTTSYNLSKIDNISLNANIFQKPLIEDFLFVKEILTTNRITASNLLNLNISKVTNLQLSYFNNDMYNQFQNIITLSYQKSKGNMLASTLVNENFIKTIFFFNGVTNNVLDFNFTISKFIPLLNSTVKFNTVYNFSTSNNFVNNSEIRENSNYYYENEVFLKTTFKSSLNFENSFIYRISNTINEENVSFKNDSFNNKFRVIYKIGTKITSSLDYDYFVPNTKIHKNSYDFVDLIFRYKSKNKKFDLSLIINNFLNEKTFSFEQVSDISINFSRTTIIPRHITFKYLFKF